MTTDSRSAIIAKLKKHKAAIKEAAKKTHGGAFLSDREFMDLIGVPEEPGTKVIVAAQLTRFRNGIDKNGQIYFAPNYVITEGEHTGTPFSEFIGIPVTGAAVQDNEKAKNAINSLFRILQNLGVSTTDWDANDLEDNLINAAEELSESKPAVRVAISRYINPNDENNHRMNLSVMGAAPSAPAGKKTSKSSKPAEEDEEVEDEETESEVDLTQLGESADEGDDDAITKLTELAEEAGLDVDDYPDSWASLAEALAESSEEEDEESEEVEEESPPPKKVSKGKAPKPKGTKGKADLGGGMVSIRVSSYNAETDEYVVTDNAGDDYEISADDIKW